MSADETPMELGIPGSVLPWKKEAYAFAARVKQERQQRQMSTWALAEQCGLSARLIHDLEHAYPVEQSVIVAVGRNLGLPVPDLSGSPVHTFSLLVRQRREQARLPQYQLAALSGIAAKTIKEIERGIHWPRPDTCIALLSVTALQLQARDIADFVTEPSRAADIAQSLRESAQARLQASQDLPSHTRGPKTTATRTDEKAHPPLKSHGSKHRLLFTLRVYVDGSMSFIPAFKAGAE